MRCNNCGSEYKDDIKYCLYCGNELKVSTSEQTLRSESQESIKTGDNDFEARAYGRGGAIASLVLSLVSSFMVYFYSFLAIFEAVLVISVVSGIAITLAVASIVLGARSIKAFKEMVRQCRPRPIATLILGIIGFVGGIIMAVMYLSACVFLLVLF